MTRPQSTNPVYNGGVTPGMLMSRDRTQPLQLPGVWVPGTQALSLGGTDPAYGLMITATRQLACGIVPYNGFVASSWSVDGASLVGGISSTQQGLSLPVPYFNGAILESVDVFFKVATHAAFPGVFPSFLVGQLDLLTSASLGITSLGTATIPAPATVADWNATTTFNIPVNANTIIDNTANTYLILVTDEQAGNAVAGNRYYGFRLNFSGGQIP